MIVAKLVLGPLSTRKNTRSKKAGPGMDVIPQTRNFHKAQQYYEQPHLLMPYDGHPSHSSACHTGFHQKELFGSLIHYYWALWVRQQSLDLPILNKDQSGRISMLSRYCLFFLLPPDSVLCSTSTVDPLRRLQGCKYATNSERRRLEGGAGDTASSCEWFKTWSAVSRCAQQQAP